MATAVVELDVGDLPHLVEVGSAYAQALVLFRARGVPIGRAELPVRRGRIEGDALVAALLEQVGSLPLALDAQAYLGLSPSAYDTPQPPATVVVCTRDRPEDLDQALTAISRLPDDGQEVLVVDSASSSSASREVVSRFPSVRYLREERPGLDRARNRALSEARFGVVAFTDDDARPDRGWLRALTANFVDPRTACVTGLTMPSELETPAQEWFERTNSFTRGFRRTVFDGIETDPFFVARVGAGANMAVRRSALDVVGRFDPALDAGTPTRSGGDHDLFGRILAAGFRIVYEPTALSRHRHRREWPELRAAIFGYGVGVYAYLTRQFLTGESRAAVVALRWLPWQLVGLVRGLFRRPGAMPPRLGLAELRGCAVGPFAYRRSVRQARDAG
jgi:glycosyltransferase involved in cell wall biosynthesis